jgi:ubiquinone biosynthesis protein
MAGRLDETTREDIETLLLAVAQSDAESLTDAVLSLGGDKLSDTRDKLRSDLSEFVGEYAGQAIKELDVRAALNSLADIIRRNSIMLPPAVSLLLRTLVLLEGTAKRLSPDFSLAQLIQPFYQRSIGRRFSPQRMLLRVQREYRDWDRLLRSLPRDLSETIQRIRTGRLTVHLDHRHLDPVINRLVVGVLAASLFLGSSLLWAMKAPPLVADVSIFGAAGYLVAAGLIWRLIRAIKRSGNVDSKDD